jgi:hypothetical protein
VLRRDRQAWPAAEVHSLADHTQPSAYSQSKDQGLRRRALTARNSVGFPPDLSMSVGAWIEGSKAAWSLMRGSRAPSRVSTRPDFVDARSEGSKALPCDLGRRHGWPSSPSRPVVNLVVNLVVDPAGDRRLQASEVHTKVDNRTGSCCRWLGSLAPIKGGENRP